LKEAREVAEVTLVGRLLHAWAAVTWKERSPMVRSRVLSMISCCWEPDRSRRSDSASFSPLKIEEEVWGRHVVMAVVVNEFHYSN